MSTLSLYKMVFGHLKNGSLHGATACKAVLDHALEIHPRAPGLHFVAINLGVLQSTYKKEWVQVKHLYAKRASISFLNVLKHLYFVGNIFPRFLMSTVFLNMGLARVLRT